MQCRSLKCMDCYSCAWIVAKAVFSIVGLQNGSDGICTCTVWSNLFVTHLSSQLPVNMIVLTFKWLRLYTRLANPTRSQYWEELTPNHQFINNIQILCNIYYQLTRMTLIGITRHIFNSNVCVYKWDDNHPNVMEYWCVASMHYLSFDQHHLYCHGNQQSNFLL